MKYSFAPVAAFAVTVLALPSPILKRDVEPIYDATNPVIDAVCPVFSTPPLLGLFPFANLLGSIVNPLLVALIGQDTIEVLDDIAGDLCIATLNDPSICRKALGALRDFVDASTPLSQSQQFGCLLDLLCVANAGPANEGTCNLLLESAGLLAQRTWNASRADVKARSKGSTYCDASDDI